MNKWIKEIGKRLLIEILEIMRNMIKKLKRT